MDYNEDPPPFCRNCVALQRRLVDLRAALDAAARELAEWHETWAHTRLLSEEQLAEYGLTHLREENKRLREVLRVVKSRRETHGQDCNSRNEWRRHLPCDCILSIVSDEEEGK